MRVKLLGLIAAMALVAACETAPQQSSTATGAGAGAGAASTASTASTAAAPGARRPAEGSVAEFPQPIGDRVLFDLDKYNLRPDARTALERQAAWLSRYPQVTVTIEGHADERGTREYNLALGERRANSVKDFLVTLGINANRVRTISYGKERPEVVGSNEDAWAKNRRGVTAISGGAPAS